MPGSFIDKAVFRGRLMLTSRLAEIQKAQRQVLEAMGSRGWDAESRFAVRAALEEALANAIEHGNAGDPDRTIELDVEVGPGSVVVEVEDGGAGFDPEAVPDPTRPENMDIPSGRGLMLMRAFMSDVEIRPPGNRVRLTYRRRRG